MVNFALDNDWMVDNIGELEEVVDSLTRDGRYGGMEEIFVAC